MAFFSHRDLADALALVNAAPLLWRRSALGAPVLEQLGRLIPGVAVGYHERDIRTHRLLTGCDASDYDPPTEVTVAAARLCAECPLSIRRHSRARRALTISDFVTGPALHRLSYYQEALRPMGIEHQIRMWLPAPPGVSRYLYVNRCRSDGDFGDRDRELLELLRPSLAASRERFGDFVVPDVDGLTRREGEVIAWVARGKTNREIADLLVLSPDTVRKHLENVFAKLHVHTRSAAVARLFALGDGARPRPEWPTAHRR